MQYSKDQLKACVLSDIEIVAIWGAFQILKLDEKDIIDFLPYLLQSPFEDIQDAGLARIAELNREGFTADIIRIFRTAEGQLKFTAAYALSKFPNDITRTLLQKWFDQLSSNNQATRVEYDAAVFSYLNMDRTRHFNPVLTLLRHSQQDIIKSSVLFTNLLQFCKSSEEYSAIIDEYFVLRDQFSDAELTLHLVESIIFPALREWWATNLSKGYSVSSIFNQCYLLLGLEEDLTDRHYWNELESAIGDSDRLFSNAPKDPKVLIETVQQWVSHLLQNPEQESRYGYLNWIIDGFSRNVHLMTRTIPKIIELEVQFLLSIPLFVVLEKAFSDWMSDPAEHVEQIANYYHSTLIIKEYREKILTLFFPHLPEWTEEQMRIKKDQSPVGVNDNKNDVIWSFYRGDLLGYRVPWPTIFPNADISLYLAEGLASIYYTNFDYFVAAEDTVAIDYALQLFQLKPRFQAIELIHSHFDYLYQHHTETLYQTIEYLPDPKFLDHLLAKYQTGEHEISRLIFLIATVFDVELPEEIQKDVENAAVSGHQISGVKKPVRLHCTSCNSSFQYPVETIYIDESAILKSNRLTHDSIWVPHGFQCKKCQSEVPFKLDAIQLDELSQQSRVDRILKTSSETAGNHFGYQTCLIDFPRHDGTIYDPGEFVRFMKDVEADASLDVEEQKTLWMKLARLQSAMTQWEACKSSLEKVKSLEKIDEEWMYLMGLVCYKLSLFAEARKYFDWIIKKYPEEIPQASFTPYVEKSRHYVNQLNSKSSRKASFKVISGKK